MERLTVDQMRAIGLLVAGESAANTASTLGVHVTTIHRWRKDPEFVAELERYRADVHDHGLRLLQSAVSDAAAALVEIVRDGDADARDRIRAAEAIMDRVGLVASQRVEVVDVDPERRLAELLGTVDATNAVPDAP